MKCDMCMENEADYTYKDTIIGTDEEIENAVCASCAEELYQANYGRNHIYFKRIDGLSLSPSTADLFARIEEA